MQINYTVRYLQLFYDDLNEILRYIKYQLKNPQAAKNLLNSVELAITQRLSNPESYESFFSSKERKYPYYKIYVKNYVIYYVVIAEDNNKIMEVRRILYGGQNRSNLL